MGFVLICFFLLFSIFFPSSVCNGSDTISAGESLFPYQTIISKKGKFELGFFTPVNSSNHYVGIWYKTIPLQTVVWVLNRDNPIQSSSRDSSLLQMSSTTLSLIVNSQVIWRSAPSLHNVTEAVILDTGNFVLKNASGILWQSFDHPTDTWLPGAMVGFDWSSDKEAKLVSWKNVNNPAIGDYSLGMEPNGGSEIFITRKNGTEKLWRSGVWQGGTLPAFSTLGRLYNFSFVSSEDSAFLTYNVNNESLVVRVALDYNGVISHFAWSELRREWMLLSYQPSDFCKRYASCGPNAVCNIRYSPACRCLNGFVPLIEGEWGALNFSGGCRRMRPLQCDEGRTVFLEVPNITFPAYAEALEIKRNGVCEVLCRVNCSCTAYANSKGGGCLLFTGDLIDSQSLVNDSGTTLYVRMSSDDHERRIQGKRNVVIVALVVPITCGGILVLGFCIWYLGRKKLKNKELRKARRNILPRDLKTYVPAYDTRTSVRNRKGGEDQSDEYELPLFSFASIAASTNNFSSSSKLGEGGFGPVYKAELANEQFVAVKKLSRTSGQGFEEFKNEIEVIAKLRRRNLVGILGCCVENEEKTLVYEYMPNKSLDCFLFVLVLEIISGRKNTEFYGSDYLSLLGYAWNLWKQERGPQLVDPILEIPASSSSSSAAAALRYTKIGLLCVQENPADRPLMSDIVAMLHNQQTRIESPRHPAFTVGRSLSEAEIRSANGLTVSNMEAR